MAARAAKKNNISFEQATARLEQIVAQMDSSETGLEEMISLVEEGLQLIRQSRAILSAAELRIKTLEQPQPDSPQVEQNVKLTQDGFDLL